MARELLGNGQAITGLLGMLTSWEEPVRLAAVRALAKVCWQVRLGRQARCFRAEAHTQQRSLPADEQVAQQQKVRDKSM